MTTQPAETSVLLDVGGAAAHLGVSEAFERRLVLERRVRYYKVGKFVRFRPTDLDAFIEAGRIDPVEPRAPVRSQLGRNPGRTSPRRPRLAAKGRGSTAQDRGAQGG